MDVKLPSVSGEDRWQAHAEFLWLFYDAFVEAFVKIFVDCNTKPADLEQTAQLVADIQSQNPGYPATRDALMHLLC